MSITATGAGLVLIGHAIVRRACLAADGRAVLGCALMNRVAATSLLLALVAHGSARAETVRLEPMVLGLDRVTKIANAADNTGRLFFTTQDGIIRVHDNGQLLREPFLDIRTLVRSDTEDGLLGLAFHPSHESNGFFYVFYTKLDGDDVVVRYRASTADPNVADPASAFVILDLPHPSAPIHNGGDLAFAADGSLYISTGDGSVSSNAQSLGSLLGKILRIDVDSATPYAIPPDNPFVGTPGARGEIFAYGLRNPWRMSFDRATGDLWIGDNGVFGNSEANVVAAGTSGQNFGWPLMQGEDCTPPQPVCPPAGLIVPLVTLVDFASMVGGYRYRAGVIPHLDGVYVFGGYVFGVWGARPGPGGIWMSFPLARNPNIADSTYGEDESGDLLVANHSNFSGTGGIYRIVASTTPSTASLQAVLPSPVVEGESITWSVELSAAHLAGPVTVGYTTEDITALAGQDYIPADGVLTFLPGVTQQTVTVQTIADNIYETHQETFRLRLMNPNGVVLGVAQSTGTIRDDDPQPLITFDECSVTEGPSGSTPCTIHFSLSTPSGVQAHMNYSTVAVTAQPGDYTPVSGTLTFQPGTMDGSVTVPVLGDLLVEDNETFGLSLSAFNATLLGSQTVGLILDDDAVLPAGIEAAHGGIVRGDLVSGSAVYRLAQAPRSSYELVLDEVSGDAAPAVSLERLAANGTTILQSAIPATGRSAVHLRWQNTTDAVISNQVLRLTAACPSGCDADDRYRLRTLDTTLSGSRFNNAGSQASILIVQNLEPRTVLANAWFWGVDGTLLRGLSITLGPRGSQTIPLPQTAGLAGQSGSVTLSHDGGYGALAGKVVALEPASGFAFDTPLLPRRKGSS
jgi:glucose/arabinose dehydrogenase